MLQLLLTPPLKVLKLLLTPLVMLLLLLATPLLLRLLNNFRLILESGRGVARKGCALFCSCSPDRTDSSEQPYSRAILTSWDRLPETRCALRQ